MPWEVREVDGAPRVPYWLQPRDLAVERRHVELMRNVERQQRAWRGKRGSDYKGGAA